MATISAVIITYNEEVKIEACIRSVRPVVDEIVVVDSGSWDGTEEICRREGARFCKRRFVSFSDQKNYASFIASSTYILSIDADERLSPQLVQSILAIKDDMRHEGYTANRLSSYAGRWIRTAGWYPDTKLRIYRKGGARWVGGGVHELLELPRNAPTLHLKGDILHHAYDSVREFLSKVQAYSEVYAKDQRFISNSSTLKIIYKTFFTFIRSYFLKGGFLGGFGGLLVSTSSASYTFYKYAKLKEANERLGISLIISTYNREDALELSILSALNQSELPKEIIVADDGSGQGTAQVLARCQEKTSIPIIHCWHEDKGFRLSAIRNKAIAMAMSEYIIMIDGDIVMHRHFIRSHRANARISQFIQGSRVMLSKEVTQRCLARKSTRLSILTLAGSNLLNAVYSPLLSGLISSYTHNPRSVRGANMSFWKSDLIRINGFNEQFVGWGREDSEFVVRMLNTGVVCKKLKLMGFGYHLYHKQRNRDSLLENEALLENAISNRLSWCEVGIGKYISLREASLPHAGQAFAEVSSFPAVASSQAGV